MIDTTVREKLTYIAYNARRSFSNINKGGCGIFTYLVSKYSGINKYLVSVHNKDQLNNFDKLVAGTAMSMSHISLKIDEETNYDSDGFDSIEKFHLELTATPSFILKCLNKGKWKKLFDRSQIGELNTMIAGVFNEPVINISNLKLN